jgi:hypothetical protein
MGAQENPRQSLAVERFKSERLSGCRAGDLTGHGGSGDPPYRGEIR